MTAQKINGHLKTINMPYSTGYLKGEVKQHFIKNVEKNVKILDAGAGCGTYSNLLKSDFHNMDGIEIYQTSLGTVFFYFGFQFLLILQMIVIILSLHFINKFSNSI